MAYSQDTGLFYIPGNQWKEEYWTEEVNYKKGSAYLGMGFRIKRMYDDHVGTLRAMDPTTGKMVWEHKEHLPLWAGVLATKGNLVFTGTGDGFFKAFDAKTGKELWKFQTGSGIVSPPITWEQDGEQYIGVTVGYGGAVPLWGGDMAELTKPVARAARSGCSRSRAGTTRPQQLTAAGSGLRPPASALRRAFAMNYLPFALLLCPALAVSADDAATMPLTINGCVIAEPASARANLRGANLANQDLRKMNLAGADLRDADLRHAQLDLANLEKARLQGANLTRASLQQSNLRLADLSGAGWWPSGLGLFAQGAQFEKADLSAAYLQFARLSGAKLHRPTCRPRTWKWPG
jgi:hypothetical protein